MTLTQRDVERDRSCTSKVRYETEDLARAAVKHLPYGQKLNIYPCRFCLGTHLGGRFNDTDRLARSRRRNRKRGVQ